MTKTITSVIPAKIPSPGLGEGQGEDDAESRLLCQRNYFVAPLLAMTTTAHFSDMLSGVALPLLTLRRTGNSNPIARLFLVLIDFFKHGTHRAADETVVVLPTPFSGIHRQIR